MKNIIVGLFFGSILTFGGMSILKNNKAEIQPTNSESSLPEKVTNVAKQVVDEEEKPVEIRDVRKKTITTSLDSKNIENLSSEELRELVRNYQTQVSGLQSTVSAQKEAIEKLNDERERRRNPLEEENLTPEQASAALNNIRVALETADPEYKEVLESALNLFKDEELETPSNDALLRHYSEEPKIQWATTAQAWLQSYFQSGIEPDINLVQLNCRSTYCELYGFYGSDVTINDYRQPAAKISNFFRQMSDGPGYANLFRNAENISLNTSSDNTFMSFHVFIRSVN